MTLHVALVGGPMYDHLYRWFDDAGIDVHVVVHADHPTLNRRVAELLAAGVRIDLLATHSKYAPSQARWLRPLDDLVDPAAVAALAPGAVELCRTPAAPGASPRLWCLPRLVDVRLLWVRADRIAAPATWADLVAGEAVFGFPGRESGLFGTFFELVAGAGGALFAPDGSPTMDDERCVAAIATLVALARRAPDDLPSWHYDDVDAALLGGRVDAAGCWPGAWGSIRESAFADRLVPHRYPSGDGRWVSYAGSHAWSIPTTCADLDGALAALHGLVGAEAQALDASGGSMCAHDGALAALTPAGDVDRRRIELTRATIAEAMITYPPHPRFPEIEDAGWAAIHDALTGRCTPAEAATSVQRAALLALRGR